MKALYNIKQGVFNTIEASFFLFDQFQILRAEIKKKYRWFLVQMRTRKFAFEINDLQSLPKNTVCCIFESTYYPFLRPYNFHRAKSDVQRNQQIITSYRDENCIHRDPFALRTSYLKVSADQGSQILFIQSLSAKCSLCDKEYLSNALLMVTNLDQESLKCATLESVQQFKLLFVTIYDISIQKY